MISEKSVSAKSSSIPTSLRWAVGGAAIALLAVGVGNALLQKYIPKPQTTEIIVEDTTPTAEGAAEKMQVLQGESKDLGMVAQVFSLTQQLMQADQKRTNTLAITVQNLQEEVSRLQQQLAEKQAAPSVVQTPAFVNQIMWLRHSYFMGGPGLKTALKNMVASMDENREYDKYPALNAALLNLAEITPDEGPVTAAELNLMLDMVNLAGEPPAAAPEPQTWWEKILAPFMIIKKHTPHVQTDTWKVNSLGVRLLFTKGDFTAAQTVLTTGQLGDDTRLNDLRAKLATYLDQENRWNGIMAAVGQN